MPLRMIFWKSTERISFALKYPFSLFCESLGTHPFFFLFFFIRPRLSGSIFYFYADRCFDPGTVSLLNKLINKFLINMDEMAELLCTVLYHALLIILEQ